MHEIVATLADSRLDDYRDISDAVLRRDRGLFIAEGRLVVRRLLAGTRFPVRSVMVTQAAHASLIDLLEPRPDLPVYEVTQETMNGVTGFNMHRGCLAIGERASSIPLETLIPSARRIVAIEHVGNADNVGSIFRNAAAFGVDGVLIDGPTVDPLYRKALRTSMGAALQVPFARMQDWQEALRLCRAAGGRVVALTPDVQMPPIAEVAASLGASPTVLVVGHEGSGLSAETRAACDLHARIPMARGTDSLNVATAAAIALYELDRARGR